MTTVFELAREEVEAGRVHRFGVFEDGQPISVGRAVDRWCAGADLGAELDRALAAEPFTAFRWEAPAVDLRTLDRPFEFVTVDDPWLAQRCDPGAFREHFAANEADVLTFENLGRDAVLVAPRPLGPDSRYGHLGAFVRSAPAAQRRSLWTAVGHALRARIGARPVWLSTAGGGVPWLHVRLDDRPKYYAWEPYRTA